MIYTIRSHPDFTTIKQSRSLRLISDYSRSIPVERVDLYEDARLLGVTWVNGAFILAPFADARVMRQWVEKRRCFKGVRVVRHVEPRQQRGEPQES